MIPASPALVVAYDDDTVLPDGAVLHGLDQAGDVLLTSQRICITWLFVVSTDRLDESHGWHVARPEGSEEVVDVPQVLHSGGRPFGVRSEVVERLMTKLKERIRTSGHGVVPTFRVPGPGDALLRTPVSNRRHGLQGQALGRISAARGIRPARRRHGMDDEAVRSDRPTSDEDAALIDLEHHIRRCVGPDRSARTDEPPVVEEGAAER